MSKESKNYQIHISLLDSEPLIWRRILVQSDITLNIFHKIIQTTMGWTNSHLHQFRLGDVFYAPEEFELEEAKSSNKVKLSTVLKKEGQCFFYEYDFGDSWEHKIILEKVLANDRSLELPICIAGEQNCPPEDCGGIYSYNNLRVVLSNPKHKEYKETIEWLGDDFEPDSFDMDEVNFLLKIEDFGCITY